MKENNWMFVKCSNNDMRPFIGKIMDLYTPARRDDGHVVLYAAKPGNRAEWYFYTSTIEVMNREVRLEDGLVRLAVKTRNNEYVFIKTI